MSPDQVMDKLVENNLAVYERAKAQMSPEEFNAAKDWYANRHTEAHAAAERLGVDPDVYLGVAAVLSAQGDWDTHGKRLGTYDSTNLQIETLLSDPRFADKAIPALDLIDQLPNTPSANGQAREKIIELYRGGNPNDIVSGWKVRNFYNNLSAPDIDSGYTMDRHAIRQALNDSTLPEVAPGGGMTLGKLLGRPGRRKDGSITAQSYLYPLLADAGWRAARRARIRPHEFQAVTWVQWRKENPGKRR
jgi:hypothetical protein